MGDVMLLAPVGTINNLPQDSKLRKWMLKQGYTVVFYPVNLFDTKTETREGIISYINNYIGNHEEVPFKVIGEGLYQFGEREIYAIEVDKLKDEEVRKLKMLEIEAHYLKGAIL